MGPRRAGPPVTSTEHGAADAPPELVGRATGQPLAIDSYIAYLRDKYTTLYGLESVTA